MAQNDFVAQAKAMAKEDGTSYRVAASALAKEQPEFHQMYVESLAAGGKNRSEAKRPPAVAFVIQAKTKAKEDKTSFRIAASALAKERPDLYQKNINPKCGLIRGYRE